MQQYIPQIIATIIVILAAPVSKIVSRKLIWKYGKLSLKVETRIRHIIKVISILINLTCLITIIVIWGVNPKNIFVALSSIFAVIGIAFFAQWSLLSNVTAGILIFFTTPFRIGDFIRIHDKDTPIIAEVTDILTFNIHLQTIEGEIIVYPNSLLFQKGVSLTSRKEAEKEALNNSKEKEVES